jgi:hypothetical protein
LFSFSGAEFYSEKETPLDEYLKLHNKAIPIYNYKGLTYILAEKEKYLSSYRSVPLTSYKKLDIMQGNIRKDKTVVIFGNNNKLKYILKSLELYELDSGSKVNCTVINNNDAKTIDESIKNIKKIDSILILSSIDKEDKDYDSDVILTLLMIQDIAKLHKADIIIELLDPKNYNIAKNYNIRNTIVSNKYISKIITQLSKNSSLYHLFVDLLTFDTNKDEETYEIYTYSVDSLFKDTNDLSFSSVSELINSCYFSSNGAFLIIGIVLDKQTRIFKGDLDKEENIHLKKDDMLIAIAK